MGKRYPTVNVPDSPDLINWGNLRGKEKRQVLQIDFYKWSLYLPPNDYMLPHLVV
jgi:hypothetical protein